VIRTRRIIAGFALFILALASHARAQKLQLPPHEKLVLKNGMTLLLLPKAGVPIVDVTVLVKNGARSDPAGKEGLAGMTAELLRKGTKTRSAQQFASDVDFIGGEFETRAQYDYSLIRMEFLRKDSSAGLELLTDAILNPAFPDAEVSKLAAQGVDSIKTAKDEARGVVFPYFLCYLYDGKEYGRPASGDEISLMRIKREDVVQFYDKYYNPANMIVAVAGDFDPAEMKQKLDAAFAGVAGKKATASVKVTPPLAAKGKRLLLVDKPDLPQTFFAIGNVGIAKDDPDRVAIQVVNTVFGERFTSQLNEALRVESGLTYGAESFFVPLAEPGPFTIFSYTKTETTTQAIDMALDVLKKLHADGLSKEQLDSAKKYISGQFPPTIETAGQLAGLIAVNEFYGLDDSEVNGLQARMDAVTPEVARRVIAKHFPEDDLVFVLIGRASEIGPAVKKYAARQDARKISDPGFWPAAK
jgi:predicted Zn-dependent peptidase